MHTTLRALILLVSISGAAVADEGVLEIDSDCVADGCFSGDSGGFPVTLANPGSYRLTSNLTTGDIDTTLVEISSDDVHLDLNGFSLIGPVSCPQVGVDPAVCPNPGDGDGIAANSNVVNVAIRNGGIHGMGRHGIDGSFLETSVTDVIANENAGHGIHVLTGTVRDSIAISNGNNGIFAASLALCIDNIANHNANVGIQSCTCGNNIMSGNGNNDQCSNVISKNICQFGGGTCSSP